MRVFYAADKDLPPQFEKETFGVFSLDLLLGQAGFGIVLIYFFSALLLSGSIFPTSHICVIPIV